MGIRVKLKDVKATDGSYFHDVQIYANNGDSPVSAPRVIISCVTEKDQLAFAKDFDKLIKKHTVDILDFD